MKQWSVILVVLLLGAACSLPKSDLPPLRTYAINAPVPAISGDTIPAHLVVSVNYVSPPLDSNRIIVMPESNRFDFIADSAWPAPLGSYVRDLVLRTFLASKAFNSVSTVPLSGVVNHGLNLQVYDFEAIYEQDRKAPRIRVRLGGVLSRLDTTHQAKEAVYLAEATREAADDTLGAIIQAFESAFGEVALEIQTSVTRDIREQLRKTPGAS